MTDFPNRKWSNFWQFWHLFKYCEFQNLKDKIPIKSLKLLFTAINGETSIDGLIGFTSLWPAIDHIYALICRFTDIEKLILKIQVTRVNHLEWRLGLPPPPPPPMATLTSNINPSITGNQNIYGQQKSRTQDWPVHPWILLHCSKK